MKAGALKSFGELMFRITIAFILVALTASEMAFAVKVKKDDKDYWANTGLSKELLEDYLSVDRCYSSENSFLGCISAINDLLGAATTPKVLTNKQIESSQGLKEVVLTVEGLKIQNFKLDKADKKKGPVEMWNDVLSRRNAFDTSWKQLYALNSKSGNKLDFRKIFEAVFTQLDNKRINEKIANSINSYLIYARDPHTTLWSAEKMQDESSKSEESFFGVGMYMRKVGENIVLTPMEGSPAEKAGLRYLDILSKVNDVDVADRDFNETADAVKGPVDTVVKLTVLRDGKSLEFNVTRGPVVTKNIDGKIISDAKTHTKVGYIKLMSFMEDGTCQKFIALALDLKRQGASSLILDIRNNGGGKLDEVLCMASSYIDAGRTLLMYQNPETDKVIRKDENILPIANKLYQLYGEKPLVMLINGGSASASELLPGALQSYNRVVTVGEKSFGKGTAQGPAKTDVLGLGNVYGTIEMVTIARFHFASGETNQLVGITPDFEVYSKPNPTELDKFAVREADLFTTAIPAGKKPPVGISTRQKKKIWNCVQQRNIINDEYATDSKSATGPDLQLTTAREVAACL